MSRIIKIFENENNLILYLVLIAFSFFITCSGSVGFYKGNVIIDEVNVDINITGDVALVYSSYTLKNTGNSDEIINISLSPLFYFFNLSKEHRFEEVVVKKNSSKVVHFNYTILLEEKGITKSLYFDPTITLNGNPSIDRVKTTVISILLPENISGISYYSKSYTDKFVCCNNRVIYRWISHNNYPTPIKISWNTIGIELTLNKSVFPEILNNDDEVSVSIKVKNLKNKRINNIVLIDYFESNEITPVSPLEEFSYNEEDNKLYWIKSVDLLPKEEKVFTYTIKYKGGTSNPSNMQGFLYSHPMKPTLAVYNSSVVSISNDLILKINTTFYNEDNKTNYRGSIKRKSINLNELVFHLFFVIITILLLSVILLKKIRRN